MQSSCWTTGRLFRGHSPGSGIGPASVATSNSDAPEEQGYAGAHNSVIIATIYMLMIQTLAPNPTSPLGTPNGKPHNLHT